MNIYVCVEDGIVNDVYVEKDRSGLAPRAIVLDVDRDRADAQAVRDEWNRVAADAAYEHAGVSFLNPLGDA